MRRAPVLHLLSKLSTAIGSESAKSELRWMQHAIQTRTTSANLSLPDMITRRIRGEPLQYILGSQPFGPLNLQTRPPILIPRPETEDWTLRLAELLRPSPHNPISLLDLCTGSGCIPLLLCHLWPPGSVHASAVDISEDAIKLAQDNAKQCGIYVPTLSFTDNDPPSYNTFLPLLANIRDPSFLRSPHLHPPFDVITSNPPYIPKVEYEDLPPSVKDFEDPRALIGDPEGEVLGEYPERGRGLTFYHDIAKLVAHKGLLAEKGVLAVEVGLGQARDVERIFHEEGNLHNTEIWKDPWDKERVVLARR